MPSRSLEQFLKRVMWLKVELCVSFLGLAHYIETQAQALITHQIAVGHFASRLKGWRQIAHCMKTENPACVTYDSGHGTNAVEFHCIQRNYGICLLVFPRGILERSSTARAAPSWAPGSIAQCSAYGQNFFKDRISGHSKKPLGVWPPGKNTGFAVWNHL